MFGLEDQKKKKKMEPFIFDIEKELAPGRDAANMKKKIEAKIQKIKEVLRAGDDKAEFDQLGALLHGYTSLLKVFSRIPTK